jgi:integrase
MSAESGRHRQLRVALSDAALDLIEVHLAARVGGQMSGKRLKKLVAELGIERATPHDLRRTCLSTITGLGFSRDAMDRIANHRKGGVTDVYDRHSYAKEDALIMASVARHVLSLVEGTGTSNVVALR